MDTTQVIKLFLSFWPIYIILIIVAIVRLVLESKKVNVADIKIESPYEKKQYIFDSVNELNLYKIL